MATYVISDIHGQYKMFLDLIDKIKLKDTDTLYILGDILDRGPHPIKALMKIMEMPNAICLAGNHEYMALQCLPFLMKEITEMSIDQLNEKMLNNLVIWQCNGSKTTLDEFRTLDLDMKYEVIDFLNDLQLYKKLTVNGKNYLLVHGGLGNFSPEKTLEDYEIEELVWSRAKYDVQYYTDVKLVTGHTPTQKIKGNPRPGYVYRKNNHIAIDCGCNLKNGRLAAVWTPKKNSMLKAKIRMVYVFQQIHNRIAFK